MRWLHLQPSTQRLGIAERRSPKSFRVSLLAEVLRARTKLGLNVHYLFLDVLELPYPS